MDQDWGVLGVGYVCISGYSGIGNLDMIVIMSLLMGICVVIWGLVREG